MPEKVLVVIPTAGHGLDLQRIRTVVENTARGMRRKKLEPVFFIVHSSGARKQLKAALEGVRSKIVFETQKGRGFGRAIIHGMSKGIELYQPAYVMTQLADYLRESEDAHRIIAPLLDSRRRVDFATGAWLRGLTTALEMPVPQYLSETRVSAAVTYANPHFQPRSLSPYQAVAQARRQGKSLQTFCGLLAFRAGIWPALKQELETTFKGAERRVNGWGIEPALLLSALNSNHRVAKAFFHRGFEHPLPPVQEAFVRSRLKQFDDGMGVVRHFLRVTGQSDKLMDFDAAVPEERKLIAQSQLRRLKETALARRLGASFLYR
jgi:hypothetical protein